MSGRLWEAHLYVFYVSWRLWEADLYVFYVVLRPPRFEGTGCGKVNWRGLGRTPRARIIIKIYSWIIS